MNDKMRIRRMGFVINLLREWIGEESWAEFIEDNIETINQYTDDMYNKLYDETLEIYQEERMKSLFYEDKYGYLRGD
jgi:hypothetical protein